MAGLVAKTPDTATVPPSAPERTLQASGQGQAIARPQGRPTLLLRACTIYALGGEWREPAAEDFLVTFG